MTIQAQGCPVANPCSIQRAGPAWTGLQQKNINLNHEPSWHLRTLKSWLIAISIKWCRTTPCIKQPTNQGFLLVFMALSTINSAQRSNLSRLRFTTVNWSPNHVHKALQLGLQKTGIMGTSNMVRSRQPESKKHKANKKPLNKDMPITQTIFFCLFSFVLILQHVFCICSCCPSCFSTLSLFPFCLCSSLSVWTMPAFVGNGAARQGTHKDLSCSQGHCTTQQKQAGLQWQSWDRAGNCVADGGSWVVWGSWP